MASNLVQMNYSNITVNVFYAIFLPSSAFLATTLNLATIFAFWKLPRLHQKPSELLILNLSCADLMGGLIVLPLAAPLYITPNNWPLGEIGCQIEILFLNISIQTSLFALISISADRFLLVYMAYPKYIKTQSHFRIYLTIVACWTIALLTAFIEIGLWEYAKADIKDIMQIDFSQICLSPPRRLRSFSMTFFLTLYVLPIIIVCSLSIAFLYFLHKRLAKYKRKANENEMQSISSTPSELQQRPKIPSRQSKNRYIRPAATLMFLVLAMAICMLPYSIFVLVMDFICTKCTLNADILYALLLLQFSNAYLDPILYALTNRRIRQFYVDCLRAMVKHCKN